VVLAGARLRYSKDLVAVMRLVLRHPNRNSRPERAEADIEHISSTLVMNDCYPVSEARMGVLVVDNARKIELR
jgi:hypothetical protein